MRFVDKRYALHTGDERPPAQAGFTLLEVMVTLTILVLASAVVVPALSKSSLAELRGTATKVAGTINATYDKAVLSGRSHRVAIDLKAQSVSVEIDATKLAEGPGLAALVKLGAAGGESAGASKGLDKGDSSIEVPPPAMIMSLMGESDKTAGGDESAGLGSFSGIGKGLKMPEDVRIMDVWIGGMSQSVNEGIVYLQFFPGGYTQGALIHLTTQEGAVFTVKVAALTGATRIVDSYVEVSQ